MNFDDFNVIFKIVFTFKYQIKLVALEIISLSKVCSILSILRTVKFYLEPINKILIFEET
jgi:hypothetical protein